MTSTVAQRERAALADLFDQLGPDQPTLCEGWDTQDLLTHLVVRERRPDAAVGISLPVAKGWTDRVGADYEKAPWTEQVQRFRDGPPFFNPVSLSPVDSLLNTAEFFIHHEDARRGQPGWTVRDLDADTTDAVLRQLRSPMSKMAAKKLGVGVIAQVPDGPRIELAAGDPTLTVTGQPGELLMWLSGRRDDCQVEIAGTPQALAALRRKT